MKVVAITLALNLAGVMLLDARMGDSPAQTIARYGEPVAATSQPGGQASTKTFTASGLEITCGYVGGKVEMETYSRGDRVFNSAEVEALLRTNGGKQAKWNLPADGYVDGTYTRADGVTANLSGNELAIESPKWSAALAHDQAMAKTTSTVPSASSTNSVNPNYTTGAGASTNAASYEEPPAATNHPVVSGSSATQTMTNAP